MTGAGWFWVVVGALVLGGLLSALFHSLRDMARSRLEELVQARADAGVAARVRNILEDVDGHSTAVGFPRIVCHMIVALGTVFWVAKLRGQDTPQVADAAVGIAAASLLVWVFGLVIPHSVAAYAAEKAVYSWSWLIRLCYRLQAPFQRVVTFADEVVRRLAGREESSEAEEIEAELMSVVEEGQEEGQFDEQEKEMIEAVVDFRKITVEQIMTPRTEIEALEATNNLGEVTKFIRQCRHSRIPVYEESLDHVTGMFYIKDLMRWLAGEGQKIGRPFELRHILRPALFVPETKTIRELLSELLRKKVHVAMVADEYGGTSGMVTLEDIVEEIFGDIQDEYEQGVEELPGIHVDAEARSADIDGRAYLSDANDALRPLGVELPESEEYDTVGGLVVTRLGRIPRAGDSLQLETVLLTVTEAEPTRVGRIRLEVRAAEPATEQPGARPAEEMPQVETPDASPEDVEAGR
jgi:putative hemolysin